MNSLKLLWQFKWVAVFTLLIEWLILAPVLFLMLKFGNQSVAFNLTTTPIGSSNFFGILIDAMADNAGFSFSLMALLYLLPALLLTKLGLAVGTMASMQQKQWRLSSWLSESGKHFLRALGLLLRWLFVPAIVCGLSVFLFKLTGGESKTILAIIVATTWLFSLSWLFLSLNGVAANERWALKNGGATLFKNIGKFVMVAVIFVVLVAFVQYLGWQFFINNSAASTGAVSAVVSAIFLALLMRFAILFWQSAHVVIWQKHRNQLNNQF